VRWLAALKVQAPSTRRLRWEATAVRLVLLQSVRSPPGALHPDAMRRAQLPARR
jgi:hypothetical protein